MRLSVTKALVLGVSGIILLVCVNALVAINDIAELGSNINYSALKEQQEFRILGEISTLASKLEVDLIHHLHGNQQADYLRAAREKIESLEGSLLAYRKLHYPQWTETEAQLVEELNHSYQALAEATDDVIDLAQHNEPAQAGALYSGTWRALQQATLESTKRLADHEFREISETAALTEAAFISGHRTIIIPALVGVFVSLGLALAVIFSLSRPIWVLVRAMERVARGDPVSQTELIKETKIGFLPRRFNAMLRGLTASFEEACHELRTPLTTIRGEAEVALLKPEKSGEEYRHSLKTIAAVAGEMGHLVDELMFLRKSQVGQIKYELSKVPIGSVLNQVVRECKGMAELKELALDVSTADEPGIWGDAQRLRQLFVILVDNAIKYSDPGGEVKLACTTESQRVRVAVSDTGNGIAEEEMPHIFERFYRGREAKARAAGGTGLGLAIASAIVKVHNGEIVVDSSPGRGTTVFVFLPYVALHTVEEGITCESC